MKKHSLWPLKIALTTFCIGLVLSTLSELASSASGIVVASMIIIFMLLFSVLTDGIGVAVTACDCDKIKDLYKSHPANSVYKMANRLVVNQERVNNICADVIGDVCSIMNGACGAAIVIEIMKYLPQKYSFVVGILISSTLAGITVGGKAYLKSIAISKADEFIMYSAKILSKLMTFGRFFRNKKRKG